MINELRKLYFPQGNLCRMGVNLRTRPGLVSVPGEILCGSGDNPALPEPNLCTTGGESRQPSGQWQHTRGKRPGTDRTFPQLGRNSIRRVRKLHRQQETAALLQGRQILGVKQKRIGKRVFHRFANMRGAHGYWKQTNLQIRASVLPNADE